VEKSLVLFVETVTEYLLLLPSGAVHSVLQHSVPQHSVLAQPQELVLALYLESSQQEVSPSWEDL
jgi:hypothetical protein